MSLGRQPEDAGSQKEPDTGEHTPESGSADAARRVTPLPMVARDAGDALDALTARRSVRSATRSTRHTDTSAVPSAALEQDGRSGTSREGGRRRLSRLTIAAGRGEGAPVADTAAARSRLALAGSDDQLPADADAGAGAARGRPTKPLLATAALVGVVLIGVPLLLASSGDGNSGSGKPKDGVPAGSKIDGSERGEFLAASGDERSPSSTGPDRPSGNGGPDDRQDKAPGTERAEGTVRSSGTARQSPSPRQSPSTAGGGRGSAVGQGWEDGTHTLTNAESGTCLIRDSATDRSLGLGACASNTWTRYSTKGRGTLLKHVQANRCLDTNGTDLYLSSCTTADSGQLWIFGLSAACRYTVKPAGQDKYLARWNDAKVNVAARSAVDVRDKLLWKASFASDC